MIAFLMCVGLLLLVGAAIHHAIDQEQKTRERGAAVPPEQPQRQPPYSAPRQLTNVEAIGAKVRRLLEADDWLVVDTETTGLGPTDVVIQLAVVDRDGNVVMNELVALPPRKRINPAALAVHGIDREKLKGKRQWSEVFVDFKRHTAGKRLVAYNAEFDIRLIMQSCEAAGIAMARNEWFCAMDHFSSFVGEPGAYGKPRRQKLPGASHDAVADCRAVLGVLRRMAAL